MENRRLWDLYNKELARHLGDPDVRWGSEGDAALARFRATAMVKESSEGDRVMKSVLHRTWFRLYRWTPTLLALAVWLASVWDIERII